jgi:hypothetical protein
MAHSDVCPDHEDHDINLCGYYDLDEPTCEHGLSAWLCEGPSHYPLEPGQIMGW